MQDLLQTNYNKFPLMKPNILLIYTGGTIGMMKDLDNGSLKAFNFNELLVHIPELKLLDCGIETLSYEKPIDSSNMNVKHWRELADSIYNNYDKYDGFVVLHGSDTMSYTGSVLSFMFENLTKPIILTGSQLPIGDLRTDAKENLITTIQLASQQENNKPIIREVCIYFEYQLYRANRTTKLNSEHFEAFSSPNYPPLAMSGVHLKIHHNVLLQYDVNYLAFAKAKNLPAYSTEKQMVYRSELINDVVVLKIFPGIHIEVLRAIKNIKGLKGIILETFGSGNAPTESWFIDELEEIINKGIHIVNVTQCSGGSVDMGKYETSLQLLNLGLISGKDITTEAALAKMMYLLRYTEGRENFKTYFESSLRGELTV